MALGALALSATVGEARGQAPPPFVSAANALTATGPLPGYGADAPAAPRSGLPPSAARHFAETVESDPVLAPPRPPAKLAYFQPSLSESGGAEALRSLQGGIPPSPGGQQPAEPKTGKEKKKDGFEHNLFGRIQADSVTIGQNPANIAQVGHAPNGVDFRRARLGMQGAGFDDTYFYRFEVDFASPGQVISQVPRVTDAYAEIRKLGYLGTLRMGEFRVPLSIERIQSANDTTFIERGLPQAFNPTRQLGMMLFNSTPNFLVSYFSDISTYKATDQGEQFGKAGRLDFTERLVFLPWYDEPSGGRYLFEFGGAYLYSNTRNETVSFATTPEANLQYGTTKNLIPSFIKTGNITARNSQIAQVEASAVLGPLSFQGEYYGTWVDPTASGTPYFFHGAYGFVSYFLTGEHRVYSRDQGYFTSVTPFTNFFRVRGANGSLITGPGAWEIAARFSTMNLSDKSIQGGRLNDVTLGVNWYLTRQMRIMVNYIYAMNDVHNKQTYADIVETRAQVVW